MAVEPMLAYLDGGTASLVLAALAAGGAGIAVLVKMYWNRFLGLFSEKHRLAAEEARSQLTGE
ncbi:hypothetical protein [Egicoccus sp. AB-alg2]|uniref:hypothetical protein n=1 Tax=Egicoccus sp. AB-alg2 TaxID=3242693 RepID=UPI00359E2476